MNSVLEYAAKCLTPVSRQTMNRIDYVLLMILHFALVMLVRAWLALPRHPSDHDVADALSRGWLPTLVLWWILFCGTMNRAADTGVTRAGFAKVYFLGPLLAMVLLFCIPSMLTIVLLLAAIFLPTLFLLFWPGRTA